MSDNGVIQSLSTQEFQKKKEEGYAIIDIRRADEWVQFGIIEGSHTITFFDDEGGYDAVKFIADFTKIVTNKEQPFILVCAHARRTKAVGEQMISTLKYENVYDLEGGINWGWIDKGLETAQYINNTN